MANLLGENIGLNYKGILNISGTINTPLDGTLRTISDGMGNNSLFQLSTLQVGILSVIARASGTNADNPFLLAYTINNTGGTNTVTGFKLNATETAIVGTTHNLLDLQVGGVSQFLVSRSGGVTALGTIIGSTNINCGGAFGFVFSGRGSISAPSGGVFLLTNNASNDFNRIQLGGTTNLFPSIKRNGAAIDFRLADDSAFCNIAAAQGKFDRIGIQLVLGTIGAGLNYEFFASTANVFTIALQGTGNRFQIAANGNVGFGSPADASALLDVASTTKGFLMPRMTTTQKNAIVTPATGLMVFDTTLGKLCVFSTTWQTVTSL
jgi:hypothetical protein